MSARKATIAGAVVVGLTLAVCGGYAVSKIPGLHVPFLSDSCRAFTDSDDVRLAPDQITNAATIAAVARRMDLPPYAVTVAYATAFQESKLRNIQHGDRDSLGLFQQRPSQGWGTAEEITEPRIASERFLAALTRIPGWQDMSVADAAQAVQVSAHPNAYAKHETKSRNLASALIGQEGAAVTCILRGNTDTKQPSDLRSALAADFGNIFGDVGSGLSAHDAAVSVEIGDQPELGWQVAGWLVAKANDFGINEVRYHGQRWTADSGKWRVDDDADNSEVTAALAG